MNFKILKYQPVFSDLWNDFISKSKNGTFLFYRNFMEYHKDRFTDFSLLVFKDDKLVAVLPANVFNTNIYSHQGLTYGGLIVSERLRSTDFFAIFRYLLKFLNDLGFSKLYIKDLPAFIRHNFLMKLSIYNLF